MDNIIPQLEAFRLKCYRKMLLKDIEEDYSIQDYHSDWHNSQDAADRLFSFIATHDITP